MFLVGATSSFQVNADAGHNHGSVDPNGRFTPNVEGAVFPPQPRNVTNVRSHSPRPMLTTTAQEQAVGTTSSRLEVGTAGDLAARAAQQHPQVQALLGDRYTLLQSARVRDKAIVNKNTYRVEFFSLSENRTVVATSVDGVITDVSGIAASERQPALGVNEKAMAIDIARRYWRERNDSRIEQLTGYAIQTFQPDGSPYDTRVVYVSFHAQSPEPPELLTWVDLTEGQVFRAEVER
ncbi:MAG: hypothetical protein AB8B97_01400 [Granulosicoccus sp.]